MKKGTVVNVHTNPKDDNSRIVGQAVLLEFDNDNVYLDGSEGFENWVVQMNGQKRNAIVHPRHAVKSD